LHRNRSIALIDVILSENELENDGTKEIVESLVNNTTLKNLDLQDNGLGKDAAKSLVSLLVGNPNLQILKIR
jgi:Ran GTPase-activating protein (RanGAP) involved in mRNA processing and transport